MKGYILYTKLQRPPVAPDIVPRDRLLDRLNAGLQRPLTLISAPAGYGKSTLSSRWAAGCDYPNAWVSLEESDSDLQMFLSYVLAAIQTLFPRTNFRTEAILETSQMPPAADLARHLLNDLHQISEPFNLVLDDYHRIQRGSPVNDLLDEFLAYPPRGMHLVLLTRQDPALQIASMRGRGLLNEIRASDLRFTPDESAAFLSRMLNVIVDQDMAAILEAKTEGWAVGLRLAGLYLQSQKELKRSLQQLSGNSRHIAEYLLAEVVSKQHPEMVSYLLETSILDRFCAPLCCHLHQTGNHGNDEKSEVGAEQFIQSLTDTNLFVIALDNEGYWFRYHHLFHDFLKGELHKQFSTDRIADQHRTAGTWFAENDLIEEAVRHFVFAGDTSAAVQLIIDRRYELLNASRVVRLGHWLRLLPEKEVEQNPLLICTQAYISIMLGNFADLKFFTEKAVEMMAALSPASDIYSLLKGEVLVLQGLVIMLGGDAPRSLAHADESMGYLPEDALLIRSLGIGVSSACHQMMGNCDHARALLREAVSNRMWPTNIQARLYYYLSIVSYLDGDLTGAMNASRECLRCLKDTPFAHTRAFANYFLGVGHYLRNERDAVEPFLMAVWADRHACNPSYVVQASLILACMYLSQGNEFAAVQMLNQILVYCREFDQEAISAIVQPVEAEIALRRGDLQRVQQACKQADFDVYILPWLYYLPKLTPIKLMLAESTEQSLRKAHGRLSALDDQMRRINRKSVLIEILALQALVCHKLKDETAALQNLQTALDLAESGSWIRTFVDLGMPMMDLLNCLVQQQTDQTYAQQVLKACLAENRKKASMELDTTTQPRISEPPPNTVLTRREIEILPLLAKGLSNKEIAARLRIAPVTVKTHLQNIYTKLNSKNRIEALKKSREIGIIIDK